MNIGLISPFPDIQSFGLRTLSACLKQEGHNVKILFLQKHFWDSYKDSTLDETVNLLKDCDLIGLTVMSNFWDNSVQITKRLKKDTDALVIWGGTHPTIRPEESIERGGADLACVGEGEEVIVELARRIEKGEDYSLLEGLVLRNNGKFVANKPPPLILDLDKLPFQDYGYETHYVLDGDDLVPMTPKYLEKHSQRAYVTMPTRGCPFACTFCVNDNLNKMNAGQPIVRKRSMANVIEELRLVKRTLPHVERIYFDDDAFILVSTEDIREFTEGYKKYINLPLSVTGITPATLRRDKLTLLIEAGVSFLRMGIQSASEAVKADYKRNYSNKKVFSSAQLINEFKDQVGAPQFDIILDNPWETDENLEETLMMLAKLPAPYHLGFYSLTFYPGTPLYDKAKEDGILKDGFEYDLNEVYRKYYQGHEKTYLNKVFFLLNHAVGEISPKMMSLLLNKKLRKLKMGWLLYWLLTLRYLRPFRLISEAAKDLSRGDLYRIKRWFRWALNMRMSSFAN